MRDVILLEFTKKGIIYMIDNIKGLSVVDEYGTNGTSLVKYFRPFIIYAKLQLMRVLWICRDSQTGFDLRLDLVMASANLSQCLPEL